MKKYIGFVLGCLVGAAAVGLANWLRWSVIEVQAAQLASQPERDRFENKYLAAVTDMAQLALMVRATHPELVPEWLDETLLTSAGDVHGQLRKNGLAGTALWMIEAYYTKNGLPLPPELSAIFSDLDRECSFSESYSATCCKTAIDCRLAQFDKFMAERSLRDGGEASSEPLPMTTEWKSTSLFHHGFVGY